MDSIQSQINQMQSYTAQQQQLVSKTETNSNEMDQDMFLQLMMAQLQYQDPLSPMDNTEFLSQQAQFTQVSELQNLSKAIESNNGLTQGASLVGKEVTLMDPDDPTKTIEGLATSAVLYENGCALMVNGKEYPVGLVLSFTDPSIPKPETDTEDGTTDEGTTEEGTEGASAISAAQEALSAVFSPTAVSKIDALLNYATDKIGSYIK